MINALDLAKALANNALSISTINGYNLVPNNETYLPGINETWVQQAALFGDERGGLADDSSDLQFGIYQISIHTPKTTPSAEWDGLAIAGVYKTGFKRGTELVYNNQMVRMMDSSLRPLDFSATHLTTVLSVRYSVIN